MNLKYCYYCGYDVNHDVYNCPIKFQKKTHLPHITRDNAHMVEGESMKVHHKKLPDRKGAGQGWTLEHNLGKARYNVQNREEWKQHQTQAGQSTWKHQQGQNQKWRTQQQQKQQQWSPQYNQWHPQNQNQKQANNAWQMTPHGPMHYQQHQMQ